MQSIVIFKLCRELRLLKISQVIFHYSIIRNRKLDQIRIRSMSTRHFEGKADRYNGILIDSIEEPCTDEIFANCLEVSLQQWITENKRTIWFRVHLPHTTWVPTLTKQGFKFHHAKTDYVMLYRWLPLNQDCNVPPYAHTNIGVGAFVYNQNTGELLVIKEKNTLGAPLWKLPGGYVEPEENLTVAAQREVLEETGLDTTFQSLLAFRHSHNQAFGCSDIYFIIFLIPKTFDIRKCEREISECQWMKLEEYANHEEVHANNRTFAKKMIQLLQDRMGMVVEHAVHPITKKPICVYSISKYNLS